MSTANFSARLCVLASVLMISAQLLWQWWQGGIEAHHLLADPTLPEISNAWGLLVLPVLGWLTARRMQQTAAVAALWRAIVAALLYGGLIAVLFVTGQENLLLGAIVLTFVLALFLPLYRAEYLLGYVAGLSFAFGPVLPLLPATPAIAIACLVMLSKMLWTKRRQPLMQ